MIINEDSWHFKLTDSWQAHDCTNLCEYSKLVLLGLAKRLLLGAAAWSVLFGVLHVALALWFRAEPEWPGQLLIIVCGVVLASAMVIGVTHVVMGMSASFSESDVAEVLRAWKEKYCPLVEFVKEEQRNG